ncbi:DNA replication licensing factor mcm6 [Porphyridium purpureum]|uniref:DNA replication licensing factor MCM6 n=1 Tax=Porphyridium purpureum TaxID=35688 RepID=A0A5J4Z5D8_PORPP|nr:DNA replication licensing factor mcm6 [Porphyridium purpureum]|eukprot:POR6814..scf295_1
MEGAGNVREAGGAAAVGVVDSLVSEVARRFALFLDSYTDRQESAGQDGADAQRPDLADVEAETSVPVYVRQLAKLRQMDRSTLYVDFAHLLDFDSELAESMETQFYRFEPALRNVVFKFIERHLPDEARGADGAERPFWISVFNLPVTNRLRELRASRVGQLLSVSGTVTRTSESRPELIYGTFVCNVPGCGKVTEKVEQQFKYTEPTCLNCGNKDDWKLDIKQSVFADWQKVKLQENSLEIPAGSLPRSLDVIVRNDNVELAKAGDKVTFTGTLIVVPDASTLAAAGEKVEHMRRRDLAAAAGGISGAQRNFGTRELTYRLCFLASHIAPTETNYQSGGGSGVSTGLFRSEEEEEDGAAAVLESFTPQEKEEIFRLKGQPRLLKRLSSSIAPNVFGHSMIKRGILLLILGGVHKRTQEGIALRGDINCCLVGDPSCAKSQFLKYVVNFLPRAVYTSGKASSAAGLTASVAKDAETGEFMIEAGALMLADNSVCCIDEFDKMETKDQVAIHEAMEQQTISISKAGLQATLNARTSILAAANPIGGRYDTSKTLRQNLMMSAPIMSRFDLFFVIVDKPDKDADFKIARFVVDLHCAGRQGEAHRDDGDRQARGADDVDEARGQDVDDGDDAEASAAEPELSQEQLRRYIRYARTINPKITSDAKELLVKLYKELRQRDATAQGRGAYKVTVRQLESLIRLSEAIARLHLDDFVRALYVQEAAQLLDKSILHVDDRDVELADDAIELARAAEHQLETEAEANAAANADSSAPHAAGAQAQPEEHQMTITFGEFRQLVNRVVVHLRRMEAREGGFGKGAASTNDLVRYLLECRESQDAGFSSEAELVQESKRYKLVIKRMVNKERILLELPDQDPELARVDRLLVVHPNYTANE